MKFRKSTHHVHIINTDHGEVEVDFEPAYENFILAERVGDKMAVAYLVYDHDCRDIDDTMGDCMGRMVSFHRDNRDHSEGLEALGNTRDGEADLDKVFDNHTIEVLERYIPACLAKFDLQMLKDDLSKYHEPLDTESDEEFVTRALNEDFDAVGSWGSAWCEEVLQEVLEKMWAETEFFPGNKDAVMLSCYSHGGDVWSMSGGGMQCRWDTSNQAGVWFPDECLRKELDSSAPTAVWAQVTSTHLVRGTGKSYQLLKASWVGDTVTLASVRFSDDASELYKDRDAIAALMPTPTPKQLAWGREHMARIYCAQFLSTYNAVISGDVYGCVVQTYELDADGETWTECGDRDDCWGFINSDYAMEALKAEYLDPAVQHMQEPSSV